MVVGVRRALHAIWRRRTPYTSTAEYPWRNVNSGRDGRPRCRGFQCTTSLALSFVSIEKVVQRRSRVAAALFGAGTQPPSLRSGSSIVSSIRHPHWQAVQKIVDAITNTGSTTIPNDVCCFVMRVCSRGVHVRVGWRANDVSTLNPLRELAPFHKGQRHSCSGEHAFPFTTSRRSGAPRRAAIPNHRMADDRCSGLPHYPYSARQSLASDDDANGLRSIAGGNHVGTGTIRATTIAIVASLGPRPCGEAAERSRSE